MAVRGTISTWTSVFTVTCLFLWVKDVDCSECSELASLLETPFILPCQTTTTHVTGSSVVFDFYDSASLTVDRCSCSVTIPSTSNFRLSMSAYQGLGIVSDPGCGSQIEVNNSRSELLTMVCQVFGSLSMNTGDNAVVKLIREQNADSRYCMMMNTVVIIIPVVVGLFVLLVLLLVVKQLVSTYRTKKQRHEPDREKLKFGSTFPKMGIFQHPTEMMETTHYNSNEDLHGQNRYTSVTNPVYVHEESEYLPDLTDKEIANFTSEIDSSSRSNGRNREAPLDAVVNKTNIKNSLDISKMSDLSRNKSSSECSEIGALAENERNLRQKESFYY
ncbi:uncharacterized protein LOC132551498 [Ylistrum balloti]|uniref:uncharacterized protein LOC132551498 n=1 Tax=Ylistrum balloti TaxID=509963 RepID=UPI002905D246|nr:uncharacterized protein LOC132551498 [Ylistrum balloti]